jgi:NitT/TauT family transport system permease protein
MAEATISSEPQQRTQLLPRLAGLQAVVTFVLVMIALAIIWTGIKAVFNLENRILPNITDIGNALFTPIQQGKPFLAEILFNATVFTMREAALGFALGATVGFVLAVLLAHSVWLERGLMPFVVASQTVPILAIAPIVVIWMKAGWLSVAVISAYLTFFPVTINTLRGLISVPPTAVELMQSYAATRWQILTKLRIQHALPYIFTALKISATASIVGAIIGELPSGIQDGLGGAIINFNQYYASGPERLWATNLAAALAGILAYVAVAIVERFIVRWNNRNA